MDNNNINISATKNNKVSNRTKINEAIAITALIIGIVVLILVLINFLMLFCGYSKGDSGATGRNGKNGERGPQGIPGPINPYQFKNATNYYFESCIKEHKKPHNKEHKKPDGTYNNILTFNRGEITSIQGKTNKKSFLSIRLPNDTTKYQSGDTISIFNNTTSLHSLLLKVDGVTLIAPSSTGTNTDVISLEPSTGTLLTLVPSPDTSDGLPFVLTPN